MKRYWKKSSVLHCHCTVVERNTLFPTPPTKVCYYFRAKNFAFKLYRTVRGFAPSHPTQTRSVFVQYNYQTRVYWYLLFFRFQFVRVFFAGVIMGVEWVSLAPAVIFYWGRNSVIFHNLKFHFIIIKNPVIM